MYPPPREIASKSTHSSLFRFSGPVPVDLLFVFTVARDPAVSGYPCRRARRSHFARITDPSILRLLFVLLSPPPAASSATAVVVVVVAVVAAATPMPASPFRTDRLISECTILGASWWDYRGSSTLRNRSFQSENQCWCLTELDRARFLRH